MDAKDLTTKDARQNQKHFINVKLVDLIEYRQSRKWYVSIAVVGMFSLILAQIPSHNSRQYRWTRKIQKTWIQKVKTTCMTLLGMV